MGGSVGYYCRKKKENNVINIENTPEYGHVMENIRHPNF
jgi:hypothetical protein